MKIAIFQGPKDHRDVTANLALMADTAKEAAAAGARLLVLPEMFLTGYHIGAEAVGRLAETTDGASAKRAAEIARAAGIALLYGYPERGEDGRIYNAALLVDGDGQAVANHRKTHLFGDIDKNAFSPGDGPSAIAELDGMKLGILICYDVEFPEAVRLLALEGADLVVVPTALMAPYDFIADDLVRARAYENQVFLAYANRVGEERELSYLGKSCIIASDGTELARADANEALIVAELDVALLKRSRAINTYLTDRRPALYAQLAVDRPAPTSNGGR
ncbi:MAG: carbon-nitrogen hydrolase family protein [Pseudomonadota bacterium]